jgi:hypothetical protein
MPAASRAAAEWRGEGPRRGHVILGIAAGAFRRGFSAHHTDINPQAEDPSVMPACRSPPTPRAVP